MYIVFGGGGGGGGVLILYRLHDKRPLCRTIRYNNIFSLPFVVFNVSGGSIVRNALLINKKDIAPSPVRSRRFLTSPQPSPSNI